MEFEEFEKFEKLQKEQEKKNDDILFEFGNELLASGLTQKTVNNHTSSLDFFLNYFLLRTDVIAPEDGIAEIDEYFNYFFPRKAMWSSCSSVNATCTALKKFYKFLLAKSMINEADLVELHSLIKDEKPGWLTHYEVFDEPW